MSRGVGSKLMGSCQWSVVIQPTRYAGSGSGKPDLISIVVADRVVPDDEFLDHCIESAMGRRFVGFEL